MNMYNPVKMKEEVVTVNKKEINDSYLSDADIIMFKNVVKQYDINFRQSVDESLEGLCRRLDEMNRVLKILEQGGQYDQ